jgi:hypothetical protein
MLRLVTDVPRRTRTAHAAETRAKALASHQRGSPDAYDRRAASVEVPRHGGDAAECCLVARDGSLLLLTSPAPDAQRLELRE